MYDKKGRKTSQYDYCEVNRLIDFNLVWSPLISDRFLTEYKRPICENDLTLPSSTISIFHRYVDRIQICAKKNQSKAPVRVLLFIHNSKPPNLPSFEIKIVASHVFQSSTSFLLTLAYYRRRGC